MRKGSRVFCSPRVGGGGGGCSSGSGGAACVVLSRSLSILVLVLLLLLTSCSGTAHAATASSTTTAATATTGTGTSTTATSTTATSTTATSTTATSTTQTTQTTTPPPPPPTVTNVHPTQGAIGLTAIFTVMGTGFYAPTVLVNSQPCVETDLIDSGDVLCNVTSQTQGTALVVTVVDTWGNASWSGGFSFLTHSESVTVTIPGDISTWGDDTAATNFRTTLATFLGLQAPDQIFITSVTAGSVVVMFYVCDGPVQIGITGAMIQALKNAASDGTLEAAIGVTQILFDGNPYPITTAADAAASGGRSLPTYATALIVVACIVAAALVAGLVAWRLLKKKPKQTSHAPPVNTMPSGTSDKHMEDALDRRDKVYVPKGVVQV